jgi:geranylgeranyl diphosphate synthase, type II
MYTQPELKELIDRALSGFLINDEAERLTAPVRYFLSLGGKRLRPVLTLMSCNIFSDKIDHAVLPAAGIEVFHNFTLVHDDIMDHAALRRNLPTVHAKWNINQAILSGDVMAFIANDYFLQTPSPYLSKVFNVFNKAAIQVCVGQQLDMDFEKMPVVSYSEYLRMIELKTAVLLAASARIGAILGNSPDKDSDLLYEFGRNLGLAFQIQDDLLDVYGDASVFGKNSGGDIVTNKKTFLLVKALEMATGSILKQLQVLLGAKEFNAQQKIKDVMDIYDRLEIRQLTENLAKEYISAAIASLDKVSVTKEKKNELYQVATSLSGRNK